MCQTCDRLDKIRIRRSIEYPVAGVAVALRREGDTLATCASPSPAPIRARCCSKARASCAAARSTGASSTGSRAGARPDHVDEDDVSPGHYRRRVAGVLARG